jgi:hypothetical protein
MKVNKTKILVLPIAIKGKTMKSWIAKRLFWLQPIIVVGTISLHPTLSQATVSILLSMITMDAIWLADNLYYSRKI